MSFFALVGLLITFNITSGIEPLSGSFLMVPSMSTGTLTLPTASALRSMLSKFLTSLVQ